MKYIIPIIGGLLLFSGCQQTSKKSETPSNSTADTTYFALQTAMIKRAEVEKVALPRGDRYRVNLQLKDRYREEYARATEESIGQIFALTYHGDILASPMVNTKITSGRTTTGIFKTRAQAEEIKRRILGKQEE